MGLLDGLWAALGLRAEADARRDADPEDLFGMSTAYITMEADLGYESMDVGALCFSGVQSRTFREAVAEVEAILEASQADTGTEFAIVEDDHGYKWVVLDEDDPEDLVTSMHFAADTFIEHGYGSRLLAALFAYRNEEGPVYWIYSFRRGAFYPFAPRADRERDTSTEFSLESTLDGELTVESDREYWHPLWPSRRGTHPWE